MAAVIKSATLVWTFYTQDVDANVCDNMVVYNPSNIFAHTQFV